MQNLQKTCSGSWNRSAPFLECFILLTNSELLALFLSPHESTDCELQFLKGSLKWPSYLFGLNTWPNFKRIWGEFSLGANNLYILFAPRKWKSSCLSCRFLGTIELSSEIFFWWFAIAADGRDNDNDTIDDDVNDDDGGNVDGGVDDDVNIADDKGVDAHDETLLKHFCHLLLQLLSMPCGDIFLVIVVVDAVVELSTWNVMTFY